MIEKKRIISSNLHRPVMVDFYVPEGLELISNAALLLFNDGQLLQEMNLLKILTGLYHENKIQPLLIAGIHAGKERKQEYGTAGIPNYKGEGSKAGEYARFILKELLPFIYECYAVDGSRQCAFAGFSLGGLSALDMVWNHPDIFNTAAVFSGSLWWRTKALNNGYNENTDRIMHVQVNNKNYQPGLKFFFECGLQDETADRNNNGKIDAVEDTEDLIDALKKKGYRQPEDIYYLLLKEGSHNTATWAQALPEFLLWRWKII